MCHPTYDVLINHNLVRNHKYKLGEERVGEDERAGEKVKTHPTWGDCMGDCNGHLRNIIIKAMITAATGHLQAELEDDLPEFSSFDRVTVDVGDLIRSTASTRSCTRERPVRQGQVRAPSARRVAQGLPRTPPRCGCPSCTRATCGRRS